MTQKIGWFRLIVAGSRDFNDYDLLKKTLDALLVNQHDVKIVSGGARGADALGERYAKENGHKLTIFPAEWTKLGKAAGFIRNEQMAEYSDALVAFWDGESKGTKHMIDTAKKFGLNIRIKYI